MAKKLEQDVKCLTVKLLYRERGVLNIVFVWRDYPKFKILTLLNTFLTENINSFIHFP